MSALSLTHVGGPTVLIEWRGMRLLTDPTFDPAGTSYESPAFTLRKTRDPAIVAADIGRIDAVLLSHDHHRDNLDNAGRALLATASRVLTTHDGAERLGGATTGLVPWEATEVGSGLTVTATPARHGPADGDRGPVIGFALASADDPSEVLWFSGDTVWYEGVAEVGERFGVTTALLNAGAARIEAAGNHHLTFTAEETVEVARAMPAARIVPIHCDGWEHFSESCDDVHRAFAAAGLAERLDRID
ncbi:MAG: MBL fold metallo-hydrolase [Thermoleophilaceae bacterium]